MYHLKYRYTGGNSRRRGRRNERALVKAKRESATLFGTRWSNRWKKRLRPLTTSQPTYFRSAEARKAITNYNISTYHSHTNIAWVPWLSDVSCANGQARSTKWLFRRKHCVTGKHINISVAKVNHGEILVAYCIDTISQILEELRYWKGRLTIALKDQIM